jgi:uncharacterized membrane protein YcaP (DUF421 family)
VFWVLRFRSAPRLELALTGRRRKPFAHFFHALSATPAIPVHAAGTYCKRAVNEAVLERCQDFIDRLLGLNLGPDELAFGQMAWRGFIVFIFAIVLVRLGARRLLAQSAGFDIVVAVILGSVLSRSINGQAAFFPTLGVSALLVALHHVMATLAFHSHWWSEFVKGRPRVLVRNGEIDRDQMRRSKFTRDDLDENLRLHGNVGNLAQVAEARLERNGAVSVVRNIDVEEKSKEGVG